MRIVCARETLEIYNLLGFRSEDATFVCKGNAWKFISCLDSAARMRLLCARETLGIYKLLGFRSEDANFVCKGSAWNL
jgi:hypothetical protein